MKKYVIYRMPEGEYGLVIASPKTADKIQQVHQSLKEKGCTALLTRSVPEGLKAYPDFVIERAILPVYVAGIDQAKNEAVAAKPVATPATPPTVIHLGTGDAQQPTQLDHDFLGRAPGA